MSEYGYGTNQFDDLARIWLADLAALERYLHRCFRDCGPEPRGVKSKLKPKLRNQPNKPVNSPVAKAKFREFVGGPWDGELRLCRTKKVWIPRFVPGEGFGRYEYVLDSEGDMVLVEGS